MDMQKDIGSVPVMQYVIGAYRKLGGQDYCAVVRRAAVSYLVERYGRLDFVVSPSYTFMMSWSGINGEPCCPPFAWAEIVLPEVKR